MTKGNAIIRKNGNINKEIIKNINLNSLPFHFRCLNFKENILSGDSIKKEKINDTANQKTGLCPISRKAFDGFTLKYKAKPTTKRANAGLANPVKFKSLLCLTLKTAKRITTVAEGIKPNKAHA